MMGMRLCLRLHSKHLGVQDPDCTWTVVVRNIFMSDLVLTHLTFSNTRSSTTSNNPHLMPVAGQFLCDVHVTDSLLSVIVQANRILATTHHFAGLSCLHHMGADPDPFLDVKPAFPKLLATRCCQHCYGGPNILTEPLTQCAPHNTDGSSATTCSLRVASRRTRSGWHRCPLRGRMRRIGGECVVVGASGGPRWRMCQERVRRRGGDGKRQRCKTRDAGLSNFRTSVRHT